MRCRQRPHWKASKLNQRTQLSYASSQPTVALAEPALLLRVHSNRSHFAELSSQTVTWAVGSFPCRFFLVVARSCRSSHFVLYQGRYCGEVGCVYRVVRWSFKAPPPGSSSSGTCSNKPFVPRPFFLINQEVEDVPRAHHNGGGTTSGGGGTASCSVTVVDFDGGEPAARDWM